MIKHRYSLFFAAIVLSCFGCGSSAPSTANTNADSNSMSGRDIKLDPANMPPGLSGSPLPVSNNNLPPGISLNSNTLPSGKTTPGIPSAEQLRKGFTPGKSQTPGIPDPATIRKQLGLPATDVNASPGNNVPMMKSNRKLGGKP